VKNTDLNTCLRLYRRSIDAYRELSDALRESQAEAEGSPFLSRVRRLLNEAMRHLDRIGEGISVVPELAESLREESRACAQLKDQAARAGLIFRLDVGGREEHDLD
jgi:hypothetical protein